MSVDVVAHDHHGTFVEIASNIFQQVANPALAEAIAIRFSLSWANEEGMDNLVVTSNCISSQRLNLAERPIGM
jgi:hypothetical protein